jgi:hypothetical protein
MHTPLKYTLFYIVLPPTLNTHKMFNEKDIVSALANINTELKTNVKLIAEKWKVDSGSATIPNFRY